MIENEDLEKQLHALEVAIVEAKNNSTVENLKEIVQINLFYGLPYFQLVENMLHSDVMRALKYCKKFEKEVTANVQDTDTFNEWQYAFRCLIRSFFAEVEGVSHVMRQMVISAHERKKFHIKQEEFLKLKTERRNSFIANFDLAFRYFPLLFKSEFKIDKNQPDWNDFKIALEARNDITHPKDIACFFLSPDIYISLQKSIVWFAAVMADMIKTFDKNKNSIDPDEITPFKLLDKKVTSCPR